VSRQQPARVLVADDEPHVREFLRDFLTSQRYEVAAFATGAQLLNAVRTFQPDVVVVDMLMPGLSGTDVLAALRRAGVTVPVILISGHQITVPKVSSHS
jgi:DNA-binding response OmpR family regulator